jgi:hypothetical protein
MKTGLVAFSEHFQHEKTFSVPIFGFYPYESVFIRGFNPILAQELTGTREDSTGTSQELPGVVSDFQGVTSDLAGAPPDSAGVAADSQGAIADFPGRLPDLAGVIEDFAGVSEVFAGMSADSRESLRIRREFNRRTREAPSFPRRGLTCQFPKLSFSHSPSGGIRDLARTRSFRATKLITRKVCL